MRPTGVEGLRGIQEALLSTIVPELQTALAQDTVQTMQMLMESIANEWDTAAETLYTDNQRLSELLAQAAAAIRSLPGAAAELALVADEIEGALNEPRDDSLAISRLTARNERLRAVLEETLVVLEDAADQLALAALLTVREAIYRHLRSVAARGWSLWDALSFRERMARLRAGPV